MAQFIELDLDQGTDFNMDLDLTNDNGAAINVTNYTFTSSIRKSFYSLNPTANLTVTIQSGPNGNITLSMNSAVSANVKPGRYLFDIKQVDSQNTTSRVVEGIITVNPQVTK
jgi:hypothetical protein